MILVDNDIRAAVSDGRIKIEPFEDKQVEPASYDLRVGRQGISTSSDKVVNIEDKGFFELKPGDFGVIISREVLDFDASHTARIGLRSKFARKGIIASTGPQVDPGFRGRLKIGVTNLSPHVVAFPYEDDFITIEIHQLSKPCNQCYQGKYQDSDGIEASDIELVTEGNNIGFAKMLESMQSLSKNVAQLSESVNRYMAKTDTMMWVVGVGISIITMGIGIIGILVAVG